MRTVALQTTSGTRYGYLDSGSDWVFPVGTGNRPWGGCINPDVYGLDNSDGAIGGCNSTWMDYSNPYGKNINATSALPTRG